MTNKSSPEESLSSTGPGTYFRKLGEDGWAVWIAGILIGGVLVFALLKPEYKFINPAYGWRDWEELGSKVFSISNLKVIGLFGILYLVLSWMLVRKIAGFLVIFLLACLSLVLAGNRTINALGVEYVIFGLTIGLLLSNMNLAPVWLREAARSEFFIKTGLVILGSSVLFTDIVKAGLPGILQAVLVVLVVWFFALWLCRKMKVDDEFGVILASAVSICGVSAAIVASGAIQGDKKKLSYVTTLVLLVAIPMLILQPWIIRHFNIPELVGGAWLGGTLDTTASVTAAAQLVGPLATKAGVIVKFSQNVLMGVAAFLIAGWWAYTKNKTHEGQGLGLKTIWQRFPVFVLGFIGVSLLFSFMLRADTTKQVSGFLNALRTMWFALAFVSIGLEARFRELFRFQGGRPALAFLGAQAFNILWTLLWAYLLFGGIILPSPDIR
jgi:uncharacterized integral membrane protein (TIGR00698 family)